MNKLFRLFTLALVCGMALTAGAKKMSDLKIYINPGHGGYTSNDRPIHLYPFERNDSLGYWESKSNLYKGLHMYHILDSLGATPMLSRIKNTEADDRSLSGIAAEANEFGADLFFSIHSNAGENVNYPLMLYRENTIGTPRYPENVTLSEILGNNLYSNQLPVWTDPLQICGDLTFYDSMWQGGLGVLRTLYVVGLLSEGGMHEHRPEAYRLMNDDYWWLEAWHFVKSIMEFYDTEDRFVTGNVAGIIYDDHNLREKDMPVSFHYFGRDQYAPINGCFIELIDADGKQVQTRTTDNIYNGVFVFRNVAPGTYTIRTKHDEYYESEATVEVKANEVTYHDMPLMMRREFPLEITSYSPVTEEGEEISCSTILEFDFNSDIDTEAFEKAFSIEPEVEGFFTYSNNLHHATFTPRTAYERSTKYTVRIDKSACHTDTRYEHPGMNEDLEFSFTTKGRNRLEFIDAFPGPDDEIHFESPVIEFRFDMSVQTTDFLDLVTITDSKGNAIATSKKNTKFNQLSNSYGNAVLTITTNLEPGETYSVNLSSEIRDKESLPLGEDVAYTFRAIDVTDFNNDGFNLISDFENDNALFTYNPEHSTGIATATPTCKTSTTAKMDGKYSARFTYAFEDSREGEVVYKYTGETPVVLEADDELGMYVFGDFNNHELYIGVTSGTDTKWIKVCDLNYSGWRHYTVSLADFDSSFTYLLDGIKLTQVPSLITQKGAFYIDALSYRKNMGIESVMLDAENGISVDGRTISAPGVSSLSVSDLSGRVVAASEGSKLNVSHLPAGVYILKADTKTAKITIR